MIGPSRTEEWFLISKLEASPLRVKILNEFYPSYKKFHGKIGISIPPVRYGRNGEFIKVYFTDGGNIISQNIYVSAIVPV